MSINHKLSNDWVWFESLKGTPQPSDEVVIVRNGRAYKATQRQLMQADGQGWVWVVDSANTSASKQSILSGNRTALTIDGLGADSFSTYRDGLPNNIWGSDKLNPAAVGESYLLRLQFSITQTGSGNNKYAEVSFDIGDGGGPNVVWTQTHPLIKGQSAIENVSLTLPVFCREGFLSNGGKFYIEANTNINIWDRRIMIQRMSQP